MKEECGICNRELPLYSLRRCPRCRKLYCRSCMIENVLDPQRDLLCLNCARRVVAPKVKHSKYSPLMNYLRWRGQYTTQITLTLSKIEGIIRENLPYTALRSEDWWSNNERTLQCKAWVSADWHVKSTNLKDRTVTFRKNTPLEIKRKPRKRKKTKKPFTPVPIKPRRIRRPSKTKIMKVVARAKNLERRRASTSPKLRHVKLKPKSAYEKRLWREDTKSNP